jgi:Fe2+ transport system protein FeoA
MVLPSSEPLSLDRLAPGEAAILGELGGDEGHRAWLGGMGFLPGTELTVLRRAPLGGPIHLRLSWGTEVAVDPTVAAAMTVHRLPRTELAREGLTAPAGAVLAP